MLDVSLEVIDETELADRVARRIVQDMGDVDGVAQVGLLQVAAPEGSKGLAAVIGSVAMTLASDVAVGALIDVIKQRLVGKTGRKIRLKAGDFEVEIQSDDLSDDQFDRLLTRLEGMVAATRAP